MTRKVILLVEDNRDDEALTLLALEDHNVANEVVVARDGVEALDYLFGANEKPQLVLLDLKLPKVDGMEVLRQIRANEKTAYLPAVILTSSKEEEDIVRGYQLGANAYVRKPVDFEEFSQAIATLGMFWMLLNRLPGDESAASGAG
jgi:two-component system, response regulator